MAFETICDLCGNSSDNRIHTAREMQLGLGDEFHYLECTACGSLKLVDVPDDLGRYYPPNYYSYESIDIVRPESGGSGLHTLKRRFISRKITQYYFNRNTAIGKWLEKRSSLSGDYYMEVIQQCRVRLNVGLRSRILDVGCGTGRLLANFYRVGFTNLLGADPFIDADLHYDSGFRVLKQSIYELEGQFDLIILSHAFEHMPNPLEVLTRLRQLLKPGQYLIVAIPVVGAAWQKYGVDWGALDAPRHLYLYSPSAFSALARKAGFDVADTVFASTEWQFWTSEQYRAGIALYDPRSYLVNPSGSMFTSGQIAEFRAASIRLNESGNGDVANFYLR